MALTKEQKTKQIKSIKDKVSQGPKGCPSILFVDFAKVPSKDMFSLRKNLKEQGCNLKIAKKTLVRIAFGQSNISFWNKIKSVIPGQLALVFGTEDEIAPYQITNKFAKDHADLKILGGIFEKKFIDREKALVLASLPTRNELLAKLVGSIYNPVSGFVRVLDKISKK